MEYKAVRMAFPYGQGEETVKSLDATLAEFSAAGWRLHSQSSHDFTIGEGHISWSTHELVFLIFERED